MTHDITIGLTDLELSLLESIVRIYISEVEENGDIVCFTREMTAPEKGVIGSLVKKGMIYDMSLVSGQNRHNFYPTNIVLDSYFPSHKKVDF